MEARKWVTIRGEAMPPSIGGDIQVLSDEASSA